MSRISTDAVRQPLRELQNNRCFYCEKAIREAAEVDHFIPWARHPDNGIENLVVADQRCNHDKRDFLVAGDHVPRWRVERFERNTSGLAQIAERASWDRVCGELLILGKSVIRHTHDQDRQKQLL